MQISQGGLELIKYFEKLKLDAYLDSGGVPTIGFGNTFYPDGKKVKLGQSITREYADAMFATIAGRVSNEVDKLVTSDLRQNQFDSLVSFAYNVGTGEKGFGGSTLLKLVNKNPNDPEIRTQFMRWIKDNGKVEKGLIIRRGKEADYYFKQN
jgi:lysozyme